MSLLIHTHTRGTGYRRLLVPTGPCVGPVVVKQTSTVSATTIADRALFAYMAKHHTVAMVTQHEAANEARGHGGTYNTLAKRWVERLAEADTSSRYHYASRVAQMYTGTSQEWFRAANEAQSKARGHANRAEFYKSL